VLNGLRNGEGGNLHGLDRELGELGVGLECLDQRGQDEVDPGVVLDVVDLLFPIVSANVWWMDVYSLLGKRAYHDEESLEIDDGFPLELRGEDATVRRIPV
jgi:hypothetical protein